MKGDIHGKKIRKKDVFTLFLCACVSLMTFLQRVDAKIDYPDFETSMLREVECLNRNGEAVRKRKQLLTYINHDFYEMFKEIYKNNIAIARQDYHSGECRIPRIIHQIWLGSPLPEKYFKWIETWTSLHGWEYKLWTDESVKNMHLTNRALYDASTNYGEKSDILRLEILYQYGGVYADVDYECLNPEVLEELHQSFDFYMGFEPLEHGFINKFGFFKVCNAIMASAPYHTLIKELIVNLNANYFAYRKCCGPVERTGPSYITRIICEYEKAHTHNYRNMYFPCTFFYPFTEADLNFFAANPDIKIPLFPETFGIHYWSGSWIPGRHQTTTK